MNTIKTARLCASAVRTFHASANLEVLPARIVVSRLDAHLKRCSVRPRSRPITTTARGAHAVQAEVDTSFKFDGPLLSQTREQQVKDTAGSIPEAQLPQSCPGCGGLTQESHPESAGFYSRSRRVVRKYLKQQKKSIAVTRDEQVEEDEQSADDEEEDTEIQVSQTLATTEQIAKVPLCDRCHDLIHNLRGQSIAHPSIDNIADSIAESPFKRNHIYHVVDAADFPMSVVPDIFSKLALAKPRSQNRRSQHDFSTKPTLSFIITRSDLLGSTKEMVDSMMFYFQSVLRQALGRAGKDMRLGNIHLVSAKRGWWTKDIKDDIWTRGGGNWMVGKVNVGKSNLFEVLFPKGSGDRAPVHAELRYKQDKQDQQQAQYSLLTSDDTLLDENKLLPPAQPEVPFPVLPVVSSLPGTTASPIRLPFGGHKGELVDLPGLERGNLEDHVKEEHKADIVMAHRPNVEQHIIRAGQSMILGGGLIRITPQLDAEDRSTTMLAYPFIPLKTHITSTEKAAAQQLQERQSGIKSILTEGAGASMASVGVIELSTDVTKDRAGPLVRSGVPVSKLPFRVYATDILIEGMGWVELVCQVRRKSVPQPASSIVARVDEEASNVNPPDNDAVSSSDSGFAPFAVQPPLEARTEFHFPTVEVFSPNGGHVSQRPCLGAWTSWTDGRKQKDDMKTKRPRRSMKGVKARVKLG